MQKLIFIYILSALIPVTAVVTYYFTDKKNIISEHSEFEFLGVWEGCFTAQHVGKPQYTLQDVTGECDITHWRIEDEKVIVSLKGLYNDEKYTAIIIAPYVLLDNKLALLVDKNVELTLMKNQ
jgi:hypothetical protein